MRRDPFPYEGPIARADGVRPFNHYLWPTEDWWAYDEFGYRGFTGRHHFGIIALADGRWSISGFVREIEANSDRPFSRQGDGTGRPVVFNTRDEALRVAVARFIRLCRLARGWTGTHDHLTEENCGKAVNWALAIAKRPPASLRPIEVAAPKTGLPLFDHGAAA